MKMTIQHTSQSWSQAVIVPIQQTIQYSGKHGGVVFEFILWRGLAVAEIQSSEHWKLEIHPPPHKTATPKSL